MATEQTVLIPEYRSLKALRRGSSTTAKCLAGIMILVLCIVCTVVFLRWRRASVPDVVDHDFGVSFDLTAPYGTAAISYPNGTIVNVAKIDASQSYNEMMFRLSLSSSEHLHPPYDSIPDFFRDQPRQARRSSRKAAGLPSSSDVGEIAELIASLRLAVEGYLGGRKISGAVATIPPLLALYQEDLEDAFEYVGLIYIPHYPYWYGGIFPESGAVYVANGFGFCSNYTNITSCDEEMQNPSHQGSRENILTVSYTRTVLTSTWGMDGMWFAAPGSDFYKVVDFGLGWDKRNQNPKDDFYWEAIRDAIITPALKAATRIHEGIDRVLLHGDCSSDERFQKILREAVDATVENQPPIFASDPVYAAARGAAEMAKRVHWSYNHTKATRGMNNDL